MQTNILWTGIEYYSLENCLLTTTDKGSEAVSVIIGSYNDIIYKVEYLIKTNENWETIYFELKTQFSDKKNLFSYHSDGKGNWNKEGVPINEFKGCIDIDISITPFTNTLPVKRINLSVNEKKQIRVLYIDVLNQMIKPVRQNYKRISENKYKFENVPNDFEAVITVDESGLVVNYPDLFARNYRQKSNYL